MAKPTKHYVEPLPTTLIDTKFGKVNTVKLSDEHYRMVLTIGVEQLLDTSVLTYDSVKAGD